MIKRPCRNECTLERGGEWCKSCGLTTQERYGWGQLSDADRALVKERLKHRLQILRLQESL